MHLFFNADRDFKRKMINNKKVIVIMPAYNAEKTLKQTYDEIYKDFVDEVILVDDNSQDNTKLVSKELNIKSIYPKTYSCHSLYDGIRSI